MALFLVLFLTGEPVIAETLLCEATKPQTLFYARSVNVEQIDNEIRILNQKGDVWSYQIIFNSERAVRAVRVSEMPPALPADVSMVETLIGGELFIFEYENQKTLFVTGVNALSEEVGYASYTCNSEV